MEEVSELTVAIFTALQKPAPAQFRRIIELLRGGAALAAADNAPLADLLQLLAFGGGRGRRPEPPFSHTWWKRELAQRARHLQRNAKLRHKTVLSPEEAANLTLCVFGKQKFDAGQIVQEMNRSRQPRRRRAK